MVMPSAETMHVVKLIRRVSKRFGHQDLGGESVAELVLRWSQLRVPDIALEVVPYNPGWPGVFAEECSRLTDALGCVEIQHIGSTSIPGAASKAIVDIAVVGKQGRDADWYSRRIQELGYIPYGQSPISEDFNWSWRIDGASGAAYVVHLCDGPCEWFYNVVNFRDFMSYHSSELERYVRTKREILESCGGSWLEYSVLKRALILSVTQKANDWAMRKATL